jgi:hypothetical protein
VEWGILGTVRRRILETYGRQVNPQNDESRSLFAMQNITCGSGGISLLYWVLLVACMMKCEIFMQYCIRKT